MGYLLLLIMELLAIPAAATSGVSINEFYPGGSPQQVELYNSASTSADISGWHIDDSGGTSYYTIPAGTMLGPYSCAVFSSDFNLNKTSADRIRLFDATTPPSSSGAAAKDEFAYSGSTAEKSFARIPDGIGLFAASVISFGRTNDNTRVCVSDPTPVPSPVPTATSFPSPEPSATPLPEQPAAGSILISEIMAYPDGGPEWVEIHNLNDRTLSLEDWLIDDAEGQGSSPKTIHLTIGPREYRAVDLSSSMFNNNGDSVRLMDGKHQVFDAIEYGKTAKGKTLSREAWDSDAVCTTEPTKNTPNQTCAPPDTEPPFVQQANGSVQSPTPATRRSKTVQTQPAPYAPPTDQMSGFSYPEVLGAQTLLTPDPGPAQAGKVRHLSFLSLSYSFLTLLSVLIKIRNVP